MKFALFALVASAAAIRITAEEAPCVSMKQSDAVFKEVEKNSQLLSLTTSRHTTSTQPLVKLLNSEELPSKKPELTIHSAQSSSTILPTKSVLTLNHNEHLKESDK
jgi:hypothetical protein